MMKDTCKFKDTCEFKSNIAEISSISLECNYEYNNSLIQGTFLIEGTYRTHELSINQENYNFKLPFEYKFVENIEEDTALVNVKDFTYTIEDNNLNIEIEYEVLAEVKEEFDTKEEFDRFLSEHEVDIVDLTTEEESLNEQVIDEVRKEEKQNEDISLLEEESAERLEGILENQTNEKNPEDNTNVTNTIINNIDTREDEYITYHAYVCTELDTLDSIANKFKISVETIKNYNNLDNITTGMKIIIPGSNE